LLDPVLSEVVVRCSDNNTAPFMPFVAEHANDTSLPPDFVTKTHSIHRHMSDGSEWLEPFRRTASRWKPLLETNKRVVFLHLLMFGDGMQLWKRRQQGFEVITTTLGEFDEGLRSSTRSPAIQMNLIASKKNQIEVFGGSYDRILDLFVPELEELVCGVDFWCAHLNTIVTVVALFHGEEGDLPGRYKAGGCRSPVNCSGEACPVCPETRHTLGSAIEQERQPVTRQVGFYRSLVANNDPKDLLQMALLEQHGLSRVSCKSSFSTDHPAAFLHFPIPSALQVPWRCA